jgi:ATP-binding cassette, subfamily F, member 2
MAPLEYMLKCFPDKKSEEDMRRAVGRFGITGAHPRPCRLVRFSRRSALTWCVHTGKEQVTPIRNLSDGQKSRVVFAWLAFTVPQLLLLDEPTNHLDLETIDALADAINEFDGGVVLVSHDFRLISQVAEEIWVCDKKKVTKWEGDILTYKDTLRAQIAKDADA